MNRITIILGATVILLGGFITGRTVQRHIDIEAVASCSGGVTGEDIDTDCVVKKFMPVNGSINIQTNKAAQ